MVRPIRLWCMGFVGVVLLLGTVYLLSAPVSLAQKRAPQPVVAAQLSAEQATAQQAALESRTLQQLSLGDNAEVFQVIPVVRFRPKQQELCANATCYQVDIYDYDAHSTTTLVVLLEQNRQRILDSWQTASSQPIFNRAVATRAENLLLADADLASALGRSPVRGEMAFMDGQHSHIAGCADGDLCLTTIFVVDSGMVWATVNMRHNTVADIWWTDRSFDSADKLTVPQRDAASGGNLCGNTYFHNQGGWSVSYELSRSDGLHAYSIMYNNQPVIDSIKVAEWHVDYTVQDDDPLRPGFIDYNTCGTPLGSGFPIGPAGEPQIVPITVLSETVGFEIRQDYRQPGWGRTCKYRYDQRYQFFDDGRWRVVAGSFGIGCGDALLSEAIYRPVMRIDLNPGSGGETFDHWTDAGWVEQTTEAWYGRGQTVTTTEIATNALGYGFRVENQERGFFIEPGNGQFNDGGTGDDAWLYMTKYAASEGAVDMSSLGGCCMQTHQQGPHNFINGEATADENIVIWYVPDQDTVTSFGASLPEGQRPADDAYCWTDFDDDLLPIAEFPCLAGPMFVPINPATATSITMSDTTLSRMQNANLGVVAGVTLLLGLSIGVVRRRAGSKNL